MSRARSNSRLPRGYFDSPEAAAAPVPAGPVLSATAVALAIGCSTWEVHELEPAGFGAPRDRRWNGVEDVYTEHGIELLVAELRERGSTEQADALAAVWSSRTAGPKPHPQGAELWYQKGPMA